MIRVLPARYQPQRISEDIPDRMPERIAEHLWDKMRLPDSMSGNMSKKSVSWWGSLEESNLFRRLSKIDLRQPKLRLVGPCAHHCHQTVRTSSIWSWILLFHSFCALAVATRFTPIRFYKQTTLRTEALTQSKSADILTQRGLCTRTRLYRDAFTHRGFYAKKEVFAHRCFVQKCFCMFLRA